MKISETVEEEIQRIHHTWHGNCKEGKGEQNTKIGYAVQVDL